MKLKLMLAVKELLKLKLLVYPAKNYDSLNYSFTLTDGDTVGVFD